MEKPFQYWKLFQHWENQGMAISKGCSDFDIREKETELGINLPQDIRDFYLFANGMAEMYPNWPDAEGFIFWPLEALAFVPELRQEDYHPKLKDCLVFADYLHSSWWYGFLLDNSHNGYSVVVIPHRGAFKKIAGSFLEFLELYYRDDEMLYDVDFEAKAKPTLDLFLTKIQNQEVDSAKFAFLIDMEIVHPDFESRYLVNNTFRSFEEPSFLWVEAHQIAFEVIEKGMIPYRAILEDSGKWRIRSFEFLCQGCFGDGGDCGVCGGSGWGVI